MRLFLGLALALTFTFGGAAQAQTSAGTVPNAREPRDRIICRRFTRIGSLIASYRSCKTNREWAREHDNIAYPRNSVQSEVTVRD